MGAQITELSRVIRQLFLLILCADRHTNTHVNTYKSRMSALFVVAVVVFVMLLTKICHVLRAEKS